MQKEKVLILVKTYPTLSSTYGELACTAGIRENGSWVRLYPIPFRRLKETHRFEKYRWIEIPIEKNKSDIRPESFKPTDLSQIRKLDFVDSSDKWQERKRLVLDRLTCFTEMAQLTTLARANELSLALFKPSVVKDFVWEETERNWDQKKLKQVLAELKQGTLFPQDEFVEEFKIADKLPYKFSYILEDYKGYQSKMMIEDWEVSALYRNCVAKSKSESQALAMVKKKFFDTFVGKTDLYFFLGTTKDWHFIAPNPFVIIGTFTPPKDKQMYLNF